MRRFMLLALAVLTLMAIVSCGGAAESPTEAPAATLVPTIAPTTAPATQPPPPDTPAAMEEKDDEPASGSEASAKLQAYADEHANGPGAIFVGDLSQLDGPAPDVALGDFDGNVTAEAIQKHAYVFESVYYQSVLERANLENPTPLVSEGLEFEIQYACINRALLWCTLKEKYMFPRVLERTNGQLRLITTSFPELGIAGPDVHTLVADGTLGWPTALSPWRTSPSTSQAPSPPSKLVACSGFTPAWNTTTSRWLT